MQNSASDVSEISEATTLTTREINYSLTEKSLEELGLVKITRPEGREWRQFNDANRKIWKPKEVELTEKGVLT